MNERIKQLALQAGGEFYEGFAGSTNFVKFAENDLEKFAELIVRECAELCMKKIDTGLLMAPQSPEIAKQILQHFGVEE